MYRLAAITLFIVTIYSCDQATNNQSDPELVSTFVELPNELSTIEDSVFMHLNKWLKGAEIIGLSEGEHGMNEGMDFRNSYIKYLVQTDQVQVLAFESGLLESRLVNDYINGKDLSIDTVLSDGFTYTFGQFPQNKDLIEWLRTTNESRNPNKRVQFYGFDMSGHAPNPYLEKSSYSIQECLNYLEKVDADLFNELSNQFNKFIPYLRVKDNPNNRGVSFVDLPEKERINYLKLLEDLIARIKENKSTYVQKEGTNKYEWGLQMAVCAKQNLTFLLGYHQPKTDHSSRERFMMENVKWIRKKEGNKKMVLFAHLSHLAKDVSRIDEDGNNTIPDTMFGKHMHVEFGSKYKVVGNLFRSLNYNDAIDNVKTNSFSEKLYSKYDASNFCLHIDKADTFYSKSQIYGIPFKGDLWMTPSNSIDVILFTEQQHWFVKE